MAVIPKGQVNGTSHRAQTTKQAFDAPERVQIIDDEKSFTEELSAHLTKWGLSDAGFNYNIVAVFGSQSTGKSTLLNRLFGTNFDVMDENKRQQTTKGIWMCRGKDMGVMVMDVEGTDGRERGEDQDFERKSALFSLASSEVLIVNIWEQQVGLYQGANMGLLKTVFEVNLGLFGKKVRDGTSGRTLLFFVVRDHSGTPIENLQTTLTSDLLNIWDGLAKPAELRDCKLADFFDLAFTTLPHKKYAAEKFESEVAVLRQRFTDKGRSDYLFKPLYHKRIPADGVAFYMQQIWEQVQNNKDLDLPTQQELLAQFRCDEISAAALLEFNEQAKSVKKPIEAGSVVPELGKLMLQWRKGAQERYDRDASRYHPGVYKRKQAELLATVDTTLTPLFLGQLKNLHKSTLVAFKKSLQEGLKGDSDYAVVVTNATKVCLETFEKGATEARIEGPKDWNWEDELGLLKDEVEGVAEQFRKDETRKMINSIERSFKNQIAEPVELALSKASPNMWDEVMRAFKQRLTKAELTYTTKAKTFNSTEEENTHFIAVLRRRAWIALRDKIGEQTSEAQILAKLRAHFEDKFRYDEQGTPRVWQPGDDIESVFKKARDQTVELIPRYSKIAPRDPKLAFTLEEDTTSFATSSSSTANTTSLTSLSTNPTSSPEEEPFDFEESLTVLTESKVLDIQAKFRKDADAFYVEAKRSTVAGIAQIPTWMYFVVAVLGWNEAMMVLFNPLYFAMLLIGAAGAYISLKLGLAGPIYQVVRTLFGEVRRQATNRLQDHFAQQAQQGRQRRPVKASVDDDEDDDDEDEN